MSYLALAKRARPLTADQRTRGASFLRALADEFERPGAGRTQVALGAAADFCYPSTAGGGGGGAGGSGLTPVEAKASKVDRPAADAIRLLLQLHQVVALADSCQLQLQGWRHDRPTELWRCGHVLDPTYRRCMELLDDGRQCGCPVKASDKEGVWVEPAERRCDTCRLPVPAKEKLLARIALDQGGAEIQECSTCARSRDRSGLTRVVTVATLALDVGEAEAERLLADVELVAGEAYHA